MLLVEAGDASSALRLAANLDPDVVVLDVKLRSRGLQRLGNEAAAMASAAIAAALRWGCSGG